MIMAQHPGDAQLPAAVTHDKGSDHDRLVYAGAIKTVLHPVSA